MPELPEVETTRLGLEPTLVGQSLESVRLPKKRLRWPVPSSLKHQLPGKTITRLLRRAKYLILQLEPSGYLILHLGMSGHLKVVDKNEPWLKHDHFGLIFENFELRLNDPRRFGAVLYCEEDLEGFDKFSHLGPEPLEELFDGQYLFQSLQKRSSAIKTCIMDNKVVVGVGNIYASESLYRAKIHPLLAANQLSLNSCKRLVKAIKQVLTQAIASGGTTLKDFKQSDGKLGYFQQKLKVYGKEGEPCPKCFKEICKKVMAGRATFYCNHCQQD